MSSTALQHSRWADIGNRRGWTGKGHANLAAMRDGCYWTHVVEADNATRDLAAADELRAPAWLSVEDAERELGERR